MAAAMCTGVGYGLVVVGQTPVVKKPNSSIPTDTKELAVRYATVYRDLAKLDYEKVLAANRTVPGVISRQTLATLEFSLIYGDYALQEATREAQGATPNPLGYLELVANSRQQAYDAAVNSRHFNTPEESLELNRLRLQAEMAQLRLAKARSLIDKPAIDQLSDRVSMLQEEVMLLTQQVTRLAVTPSR
jgi:hypothetical protein